jgi:hypothetical protein
VKSIIPLCDRSRLYNLYKKNFHIIDMLDCTSVTFIYLTTFSRHEATEHFAPLPSYGRS